jgi:hypothetical protein
MNQDRRLSLPYAARFLAYALGGHMKTIVTVIAVSGSLWGMVPAARAADKCTSIQARCAIDVGGTCDSATGHWSYEYDRPKLVARFTACVSREQSRAARK